MLNRIKIISIDELYIRFSLIIDDFWYRDYFKEHFGNPSSSQMEIDRINRKSKGQIGISIYPFPNWPEDLITNDNLFKTVQFLYQFISKPGELGSITTIDNWTYTDYLNYNKVEGRFEYLNMVNLLLRDFDKGYELQENGVIRSIGDEILNFIDIEFPEYNDGNINFLVKSAILQWKNKSNSNDDKKQAIIKLADVFEYLKRSNELKNVLSQNDSNDLFNIANNFSLRHHRPDQKSDYDKDIWYDWIFQFYLITCITTLKLIENNKR